MKNKTKRFLIPTTVMLGLIVIGLLTTSYVSAQDSGNYPSIVQKIADKFNLKEEEVQAVFDEERDERHAEMQAKWTERLDDLVSDGKITAEQKQSILEKHAEMQNMMEELRDLSPEERKQKMQEHRADLKDWADEQGIDLPLMGPMSGGLGRGHGMGFRMGPGLNGM